MNDGIDKMKLLVARDQNGCEEICLRMLQVLTE